MKMNTMTKVKTISMLALTLFSGAGMAATLAESGDNDPVIVGGGSQGFSGANANLIPGGSHTITGSINENYYSGNGGATIDGSLDVDLYRFDVAAGAFAATVMTAVQTIPDPLGGTLDEPVIPGFFPTLYLFDANSVLVTADYNASPNPANATNPFGLRVSANLAAGTYYLSVQQQQNTPFSIFGDTLNEDGAILAGVTAGRWNTLSNAAGNYSIDVNSVAAIPLPSALWLAGSGLLALFVRGRRQRNGT